MATIGSGILTLGVSNGDFKKGLDASGKHFDAFAAKIKAVPEMGEKIYGAVGRVEGASRAFQELASDANIVQKGLASVELAIGSLTLGMQLATKMTTGLKAALLGTGIGGIIVGLGALLNALTSARRVSGDIAADFAARHMPTGTTPDLGHSITSSMAAVGALWFDSSAATSLWSGAGSTGAPAAGVSAISAAFGEVGPRAEEFARRARMAEHTMESAYTEAVRLRDSLISTGSAAVLGSRHFTVLTESITSMGTAIEADRLRRVAAETDRLRTPLERLNAEIERMRRLMLSPATFGRGLAAMLGDVSTPLESFRERVATIERLRDEAGRSRGAAFFTDLLGGRFLSGDRSAFDPRFERAMGREALGLLRMTETDRAAPPALLRNTVEAVSAIAAARRNAVTGSMEERMLSALREVERREAEIERHTREAATALRSIRRV